MIRKLLIANRGEIACRIIATARDLGIETLAVYSQADREARHVRLADTAVCIGEPAAARSYLDGARLLQVAAGHGADAVHPGYGFLAENADFAQACESAGLIFVGPPAAAIRAMGSKREAKARMIAAGVPVVPGYHGDDISDARLRREAQAIGWPLLLKPSAGGGGKGMRVVTQAQDFDEALAAARREARAAFGDDTMLLEKYLQAPRHIEVQVFADAHGNVVHLFERDCSVQRRHQKVLEEAPAPGISDELRAALGEAAVAAARAIDYRGAGTVEFIVEDADFHFMEMNTRLQVEHPVTEMITGQDLVAWQLQVAAGLPLPLRQADIRIDGHALEARLYAEDPARGYLPSTGHLRRLHWPQGHGVRIDAGVDEGDVIGSHYDPMLAKLITHGRDRAEALARMRRALAATRVLGVATNLSLLRNVVGHEDFARGGVSTGFLAQYPALAEVSPSPPREARLLAALLVVRRAAEQAAAQARQITPAGSPWALGDGWRVNLPGRERLQLEAAGQSYQVVVERVGGELRLGDGGDDEAMVSARVIDDAAPGRLAVELDGRLLQLDVDVEGDVFTLWLDGHPWRFTHRRPGDAAGAGHTAPGSLTSPLPGQVIAVNVTAGQAVEAGAALMVVEAMKMEHVIRAPADGTVSEVKFTVGDRVDEGQALLVFDTPE
ncbi:MAG: acetyl/propionyl/methylcrotonyl-CoA carboxylase subunit alpha [Gammaproteobacteria bacterium]|nr:acetyl/propionyl/methylcrotonyl-CoA carboxylase subunit alpha [Gammaproteobacteria bacterium]